MTDINKDKELEAGCCCCGSEADESCCGNEANNEEGCCCEGESTGCNCMDEPGHHHEHGPGCDHDHDHEHEHMVTFENEDGTTSEYPVVDEFEFDGELYVLVLNSDETVTPLKSMGEDGELVFLTEEEFEVVANAYNELLDAEDEDEDEEEEEKEEE